MQSDEGVSRKDRSRRLGHVKRMIGQLRECAGRSRKRWMDTEGLFKKKRFGCQATKENGGGL